MSEAPATSVVEAVVGAVSAAFEAEQVPWLCELVDQPSHTLAPEDVEQAMAKLDATAAELGLARRTFPDPEARFAAARVYATPATGPEERAPVLVGHADTVFPRSLGFLVCRRDGDTIEGPGVFDMKSGLSAIFFALRAVRAAAPERWAGLKARVVVVGDEEVGSPHSEALYAELAPWTTEALVFEGGRAGDRIITGRKGSATFTLTARGRASHAGLAHEKGSSAIHALALVIPRVEALTDYERGVTVNVGIVRGGTAKNTVPDEAECVIDARFRTSRDGLALRDALAALAERPFAGLAGVPERIAEHASVTLGGGISRLPMEPTPESRALRLRYEDAAAATGLRVGEAPLQGGGSDANLLSAAGVPAIDGLGPAGGDFHQVTEWSSLESLRRRTEALARYLLMPPA